MANEAVLRRETQLPKTFTSATAMEKGCVLKLSDANTVALSDGDADYVAGVLARETLSTDTQASVYTEGEFLMYVSGNVTAGQALMTSSSTTGSNILVVATATAVGVKTFGIAKANHTGNASQILVELKPGCNNTAYA